MTAMESPPPAQRRRRATMRIGESSWRAWIREEPFAWGMEVFLFHEFAPGRIRILQPDGSTLERSSYEPLDSAIQATFRLTREQLQSVADGLAEKGIVPNQRRFAQEIDLMENHLEDMRRLVFKLEAKAGEE